MKDVRRLRWVRFFAIIKPSERRSIGIDIQGRLVNGGETKAVLDSELEYGGEI